MLSWDTNGVRTPHRTPSRSKQGYLRHPCTCLVSFLLVPPVSGSEGVFQAVRDDPGLYGQFQVEVLRMEEKKNSR